MTTSNPNFNGGILSAPHQNYMMKAFQEAEKAFDAGEVPVGAVVVKDHLIIGRGYNQVEQLQDPAAHAEMIALSSAHEYLGEKYLNGCTLYVTLEPCPMCAGALVWSKIDRLVFGAMDEQAGACGSLFNLVQNKKLNHQLEVIQGILEADCSGLMTEFFRKKRSK